MAEPAIQQEKQITDEGLDRGIEKLTSSKIQEVVNKVLKSETGARLKAYVDTCIHCVPSMLLVPHRQALGMP